jgi:hypothetical protein
MVEEDNGVQKIISTKEWYDFIGQMADCDKLK